MMLRDLFLLKKRVLFLILSLLVLLTIIYSQISTDLRELCLVKFHIENDTDLLEQKPPNGFLLHSPSCQIPDLDPWPDEIIKLFTQQSYENCSNKAPLTSLEQDYEQDKVTLVVHHKLLPEYLAPHQNYFECCYYEIKRSGSNDNTTADDKFILSDCNYFEHNIELPASTEFILVKCKGMTDEIKKKSVTVIYTNAHAVVRRKVNEHPQEGFPLSVQLIGIDSISRINLLRAMPRTAQYLYDKRWFELQGYTKIDDNTFPNLMAILSGMENSVIYEYCNPRKVGKLENCTFIWNEFKARGFATAYAEDEANIHTFNYLKKGFIKQPTDHYFRPFSLAAEKHLKAKLKHTLKFCLGYQHYADYIFEYATSFAATYKNQSSFGLFWMNTFSHNDISDPNSMDFKIRNYLKQLEVKGVLNTSIIIFFSDHGLRFGSIRELYTGWLEERMPFMFIWLPEWFQQKYKQYTYNLRINRNRLTSPYDIAQTLKHIIKLRDNSYEIEEAISCPTCQSVFDEVPWNRTCAEAGIEPHWCVCDLYKETNKNADIILRAVNYIIKYLNRILDIETRSSNDNKPMCAIIKLRKIMSARMHVNENGHTITYLIVFSSTDSAVFESTIRYSKLTKQFSIQNSISRINAYTYESSCISHISLRKYCRCLN